MGRERPILHRRDGLDHHQAIGTGLGAPYLAAAPVELTYIGSRLVAREDVELLRLRIEAHDRVGRKIGEPDLVLVVDIGGVSARTRARQLPRLPGAIGGIVQRDVAAVPLADPKT